MKRFLLFTFTMMLLGSSAVWGQEKAAEVRINLSKNRSELRADGKELPDSVVQYYDWGDRVNVYYYPSQVPRVYYSEDHDCWASSIDHFYIRLWREYEYEVEYNSEGLVKSLTNRDDYEYVFTRFQYNANGFLLSEERYTCPIGGTEWEFTEKNIYSYDTYDNWVGSQWYYVEDGVLKPGDSSYTARVDNKGRIVYSEHNYDEDGVSRGKWIDGEWHERHIYLEYYIWYYSDHTPNAEVENNAPVGDDNQGSFDLNVNVSADSIQNGSVTVTFPEGFTLDEDNTSLTLDFAANFTLTIIKQENNSWLLKIKPKELRSSAPLRADEVQKAIQVAYQVDEEVKRGSYDISVNSILFETPSGGIIPEPAITVSADLNRWATANEDVEAGLKVYARDGQLYVSGLVPGELWSVYGVTGAVIYNGIAESSEAVIPLPARSIYIVRTSLATIKVAN